jgi:NADPH:quinone reductase-like Zn-dependent oxidoreductase
MTFPMSTSPIQAIRVHCYGGPEQLKLEQIARPELQADEVLVRVYAGGGDAALAPLLR